MYKARIKILVHETGVEKLREEVAVEWAAMRDTALELTDAQIADIAGRFRMVQVAARADDGAYRARLDRDAELKRFARYNVAPHRVAGHGIVTISLKPRGGVPGDATADQMDALATLAERFSHGEIRVHHNQNLILPHVALADVPALHDALVPLGLATANAGLAGDIIACPGLDYCSLANARSIPLAQDLSERLGEPERAAKIGPLQIKISGCINACGHHHVGHIGILGVDKHGSEAYQIQIGGDATENAAIGEILGPAVSADRALTLIDDVLDTYVELREGEETLVDTYRRVGAAPFKARAYAD
jgi:sulfite reductase (NADPH) hemoprotein beta-component